MKRFTSKLGILTLLTSLSTAPVLAERKRDGTGTGNNGDEIEHTYERARDLLTEVAYPNIMWCLSQRSSNPLYKEELRFSEDSRIKLMALELVWDSGWPDGFQNGERCFSTTAAPDATVMMSWKNCSKSVRQFPQAVETLLEILFLKRLYPESIAKVRAKALQAALESGKCGDIYP